MLDEGDWEMLSGIPVFWPDVEDAALDAILTLETIWTARHRGHAWKLDERGEGPSLLTLADLGLKIALVTRSLSAVCPLHGRFRRVWSSVSPDERLRKIECPGRARVRCGLSCRVDYVREECSD